MLFAGRTFSADALRGLRRPSHKTQYDSETVTLSKIPSLPPDSCPAAAAAGRAITPQRHNTLSCICIHTAAVFVFILQLYLYSYCSCICIRAMESKSLEGNKSLKSRIWFAIGILENVLNPGCEGLAQSHKKFQFITLNEKSHRCQCIPNDHKSKGDPGPSKH